MTGAATAAALLTSCVPTRPSEAIPIHTVIWTEKDLQNRSLTRIQAQLDFPGTTRSIDHGTATITTPNGLEPNSPVVLDRPLTPAGAQVNPLADELSFMIRMMERPAGENRVIAEIRGVLARQSRKSGIRSKTEWGLALPGPIEGNQVNTLVIKWRNYTDIAYFGWNGAEAQCNHPESIVAPSVKTCRL